MERAELVEVIQTWIRDHLKPAKWAIGFLLLVIMGLLASFFLTAGSDETDVRPADPPLLVAGPQAESMSNLPAEGEESTPERAISPVPWKADIKGAVLFPGVYEVEPGMRIQDLIDRAGGLQPDAELRSLNLAQLLEDQMMVFVPLRGEGGEAEASSEETDPASSVLISTPAAQTEAGGLIDLNTADMAQLQELNGIGEKKAEFIIQYRQANGRFQTIEELMNVKGIGEKTFAALKDRIRVSPK